MPRDRMLRAYGPAMLHSGMRRAAIGSIAAGLLVAVAVSGSAHGLTPTKADRPAKAGFAVASLTGVSVVPKSTTAWAFGEHNKSKIAGNPSPYAIRGQGKKWKAETVKAPADTTLESIAAGSAKSIWIVGYRSHNNDTAAVVEHSKGHGFTSMNVNSLKASSLDAVAASSKRDAWAIGDATNGDSLAAHWNGKTWKRVTLPATDTVQFFTAVATSSPTNTWLFAANTDPPVADHWNGHSFTSTTLPFDVSNAMLGGIATSSAVDAWVVGFQNKLVGDNEVAAPVTVHWNGSAWADVPAPQAAPNVVPISVADNGKHAYLAGQAQTLSRKTSPLAMEFTNGAWKNEHVATRGKKSFFTVVSASSKAAVAVGSSFKSDQIDDDDSLPLAETLTGKQWRIDPVPN